MKVACPPSWAMAGPDGRILGPRINPEFTARATPPSTPPVSRQVVNPASNASSQFRNTFAASSATDIDPAWANAANGTAAPKCVCASMSPGSSVKPVRSSLSLCRGPGLCESRTALISDPSIETTAPSLSCREIPSKSTPPARSRFIRSSVREREIGPTRKLCAQRTRRADWASRPSTENEHHSRKRLDERSCRGTLER